MRTLTEEQIDEFRKTVFEYYQKHGRYTLPWRQPEKNSRFDPYKVLVSEIMLQQTQVLRVVPKYLEFLHLFPTVHTLSQAQLSEVLRAWAGLGYNRRAKFLYQSAQKIMADFRGVVPDQLDDLVSLPGVGYNTAAAIIVYSYNKPISFVETNIRSVYLHHFFKDRKDVSDAQLLPLIEATVDSSSPRQWYWALMDYGSFLKSSNPNPSRASIHHKVQSTFIGSNRQIRGSVLKLLRERSLTIDELAECITDNRLFTVLEDLKKEQLVTESSGTFSLG